MRLEGYLHPDRTLLLRDLPDRDELLVQLARAGAPAIEGASEASLLDSLRSRESQMPTSTPEGVAFPHALLPGTPETVIVVARLAPGVAMGAPDHPEADIVFCMFGNSEKPWDHVRLLARIARLVRAEGALERLRRAGSAEDLCSALVEEDRAHG